MPAFRMRWLVLALLVGGAARAQNRSDLQIRFWEERIQRDASDYVSRTKLGTAYLQKARDSGDSSYYDKAASVLRQPSITRSTLDLPILKQG